ncbi:smt3 [Drosophila busckii]|uniref:Smt3 n=3 Tax=Drosophila TaxID=7215 RepID=A0A0M5J8S4_DROBS|nr:smt3 [Drosophila busckii]
MPSGNAAQLFFLACVAEASRLANFLKNREASINLVEKRVHSEKNMSDEKKGGETEHINLKVLGQDNAVVQFKIKKHTPLRKLMNAYCDRAGLSMQVVRFRFDGQPINENDTPTSLEMEEGDTIEVYQQQTGGGVY